MAVITRENIGKLNEKIIVKVAQEDYLDAFERTLKDYSKKANLPGFRKGMVPTGMIRKMHGPAVFTDEVLRTVEKELSNYMVNEKLEIFAQPLPLSENDSRKIDMNNPDEYAFAFEVGLKPSFNLPDLSKFKMDHFIVTVTPDMVNEEADRLRMRHGKMTHPDTTTCDDNVINVTFTECDAAGNPAEGGTTKDNSLLIKYFKESFRSNLLQKKAGDSVVLQPLAAFEEKERGWVLQDLGFDKDDTEAASRYFNMAITKVGLMEKAELNEEFFKAAFPQRTIPDAETFMAVVKEDIQSYWNKQDHNNLQHQAYHILLDHTTIEFPESFLKRWLQQGGEQPKTVDQVEQEFPGFLNQLKWTLITDKIIRENNIEASADDLKAFAKQQLFGYMGMQSLDEEQPWVTEYVNRMMQDRKFVEDAFHRIQTEKVLEWSAEKAGKKDKEISAEDFAKELEKHQHHHH